MFNKQQVIDGVLNSVTANQDWYRRYMQGNWPRIAADFRMIQKWVHPGARILDIGAVPPLLEALLKSSGYNDLTVADPHASSFQAYFDANGIKWKDLDLLNQQGDSLNQSFDLVCFNEVIEHLSGNLLEVIQRVSGCVKPGGKLLITTPNLRSLSGLHSLLVANSGLASKPYETVRAQYERRSSTNGYFGHLREFTPKEVVDLITSFGFSITATKFQASYMRQSYTVRAVALLEHLVPRYRLFGKYIFTKN